MLKHAAKIFVVLSLIVTWGSILLWHLNSIHADTKLGQYPDCSKHPDFGVTVRSSVDRKYYFIQSCAVADSAEGEDFRHEVPFKPCDVPESNCKQEVK